MTAQRAFPPDSIAPWAEVVPNMPPMTTDELHGIPEDGWTYELINGVLVRMPLSGGGASNIGYRLGSRLSVYVEDNALKARLYLRFGTRLVWVIWPRYQRVDVWHPGDEVPTSLGVDATLDGEDVIPGFTYPTARLFS